MCKFNFIFTRHILYYNMTLKAQSYLKRGIKSIVERIEVFSKVSQLLPLFR